MTRIVRSSGCGAGDCVEVAFVGDVDPTVLVRNSRRPQDTAVFDAGEWAEFLAAVRRGEFGLDTAANVS